LINVKENHQSRFPQQYDAHAHALYNNFLINNSFHWKEAAKLKHLQHLLIDGDYSVWATCARKYLIKNRSTWSLKIPGDSSWS
jgi:hypothetical protein